MFYVYLLICSDDTLYCGYTNDLEKRINAHNSGRGAKYTKSRLPVRLVHSESFQTKSEALVRECAIKRMKRSEKLALFKNEKD